MRKLIQVTATFATLFMATDAVALGVDTKGAQYAQDAFVSTYVQAAQLHPEIVISQLAFIISVTSGADNGSNSPYAIAAQSISLNQKIDEIGSYLPQIGIGVGLSIPLGTTPLAANISANYNLNPLIANVIRGFLNAEAPDDVKQDIKSVALMDPSFIASLGKLTWDAYNDQGSLIQLHSLYAIASQYTASIPPPDAPPSTYLAIKSPFVKPFYNEIQASGTTDPAVESDWNAFLDALPANDIPGTDFTVGTQAITKTAGDIASLPSPPTLAAVLSTFGSPSAALLYSVDPDMDNEIRSYFRDHAEIDTTSSAPSYSEISSQWQQVEQLFASANAIAVAFNDTSSQRAIAISEQMVKLAYSVQLLNSASTTMETATASLGIIGAVSAVLGSLMTATNPHVKSPDVVILRGEQSILSALSSLSSQIQDVSLSVSDLRREISQLQVNNSIDVTLLKRQIYAITAVLALNKDDLIESLSSSMMAISFSAAESLREDALSPDITKVALTGNSATLAIFNLSIGTLVSNLSKDPYAPPFLLDGDLSKPSPYDIGYRPWDYERGVARHILETAQYYDFLHAPDEDMPLNVDALQTAYREADFIRHHMNSSSQQAFGNVDAVYSSIVLLTDSAVRFPTNVNFKLDPPAIQTQVDALDSTLAAIVRSEPIVSFALHSDVGQLMKHWNSLLLSIIDKLYPISAAGGLTDYQLRDLISGGEAPRAFESVKCAVESGNECDSSDRYKSLQLLIGLNLVGSGADFVDFDIDGSLINRQEQDSRACAKIAYAYPWTTYATSKYPVSKISPEGVFSSYKSACATFRWDMRDSEITAFFRKPDQNKLKSILWRYLRKAIAENTANVTEVPLTGVHQKRLDSSAEAAKEMSDGERSGFDVALHGAVARADADFSETIASFDDIDKDAAALEFMSLFMTNNCITDTWRQQLSTLVVTRSEFSNKIVFAGSQAKDDIENAGVDATSSDVRRLSPLLSHDIAIGGETCYSRPAQLERSHELLEILQKRHG